LRTSTSMHPAAHPLSPALLCEIRSVGVSRGLADPSCTRACVPGQVESLRQRDRFLQTWKMNHLKGGSAWKHFKGVRQGMLQLLFRRQSMRMHTPRPRYVKKQMQIVGGCFSMHQDRLPMRIPTAWQLINVCCYGDKLQELESEHLATFSLLGPACHWPCY